VEAQPSLVDSVGAIGAEANAGQGLEVAAGAENRALAREDHRPHPGVFLDFLDRQHQPAGDRIAERVAGFRSGQGQPRDAIPKPVGDVLGQLMSDMLRPYSPYH
jgi:hypothetical protein